MHEEAPIELRAHVEPHQGAGPPGEHEKRFEDVQDVLAAWPGGHVVVLGINHDAAQAIQAARAGADAWVANDQGAD